MTVGPVIWVGLVTDDVPSMVRYYSEVLGFPYMDAGDGYAQLDLGYPAMFEILQRDEDVPQYAETGWTIGFGVESLVASYERLRSLGGTAITEPLGGEDSGAGWAYFGDTDGGVFEITERSGRAWESRPSTMRVGGAPVWSAMVTESSFDAPAFAGGILGMNQIFATDRMAIYDLGWPNLFEIVAQDQTQPQYRHTGWRPGFAVDNIFDAWDELRNRSAHAVGKIEGEERNGAYWAWFKDPEDNFYSITEPLPGPWPFVKP